MAAEYGVVLVRAKFAILGDERARLALLQAFLSVPACLPVRPLIRLQPLETDEADTPFLEAAVWAHAVLLVSGDPHLLALKQIRNPRLHRPVDVARPVDALGLLLARGGARLA